MSDPSRHARLCALFDAATAMDESARRAFVERECVDDDEMLRELLAMLSEDQAGAASRVSSAIEAELASLETSAIGGRIGRYRILERIGEGGMGAVYLAQQEQPSRVVALKVIRPGRASAELLKRFTMEAEVLGLLHHRGIAQIYEAGTADSGLGAQPFFAMEFVEGVTLDQWIKSERPSTEDKVEKLIEICEAVHHAHQKGVIHRDLKPSAIALTNTGYTRMALGDAEGALPLLRQAVDIQRANSPDGSYALAHALIMLGRCLFTVDRGEEAVHVVLDGADMAIAARGPEHRGTRALIEGAQTTCRNFDFPDVAERLQRLLAIDG